ncbi:MAG: preprotein translocase subunit SecA [Nitrospirae bacterium]|nr:preprotein translocase subunit SecA [Nitrospirota bacterium]
MVQILLRKIFGTKNEREIKRLWPLVEEITSLEPKIASLSDAELRAKTDEFRKRLDEGGGESLDDILPEAFAVVREVSKRTLEMRHFDAQLLGGIVLHEGKISEMKTGEGKTLVATLPVYLNALEGKGVHVVTVNDYLARRDAHWMGPIYNFLGMSVGVIVHGMTDEQRQMSYNSDITYGTNNEFGFDYLRDNMKYDISHYVQRELNYAIVDEVDSILIDEARTPLIISGPSEESTGKYYRINQIVPKLIKGTDYTIDEKAKTAILTEEGNIKTEQLLGAGNLYDPSNIELVHHVLQALKAHNLFKRDVDYVLKDGEVLIVDEFTGRLMPGRRWSDGLHQAIEAKEAVKIESENQTLATITFQNYFRMYRKLSGMTGTADTEAEEFAKIYNLDVIVVPTHMPMIRTDASDFIYKTEKNKFSAIVNEIQGRHKKGQPVLVGTISIEKSEVLSRMLKKIGIPHSVLNAKYHEKEAEIIAQAGKSEAVTIATNMAGRGTDIILGGNPAGLTKELLADEKEPLEEQKQASERAKEICLKDRERVISAGGLHILGTERHEARRIDNQLRGRSGRQGDPGSSRFYLSLEDDLMRIFGSDRIKGLMDRLGMEEDIPIENRMVSKAVENAQKKVEAHNFDIRKHLIEYDDVMNKQRTEIYAFRREILQGGENLRERLFEMAEDAIDELLFIYCPEGKHIEQWNINGLKDALYGIFSISVPFESLTKETEPLREFLINEVKTAYENKEKEVGSEMMRHLEKVLLLQIVDSQWKDHLLAMDHLKEGIGLRGYGQRDPLTEYKKEAFSMFADMTERLSVEALSRLFKIQVSVQADLKKTANKHRLSYNKGEDMGSVEPVVRGKKTGRNEPCPCGSGKKYKKCCGV